MGCDIHIVLEKRDPKRDVWVGYDFSYVDDEVYEISACGSRPPDGVEDRRKTPQHYYVRPHLKNRNYEFFNALCGVRGDGSQFGFTPKGLPRDASDMALLELGEDNVDLHSHSWLDLKDLSQALVYADNWQGDTDGEAVKRRMANDGYDPELIAKYIDKWVERQDYENYRLVFAFDN